MRLLMTMVVRDEEEILEANLRYHLAQGVDFVLVTDHGSTDGTPEILREFEAAGVLRSVRDDAPGHDQRRRVNAMIDAATTDHGAHWILHNDADEFWWPAVGTLRDMFASIPERFGQVIVERHDFVPRLDGPEPFWQRMVYRPPRSFTLRGTPLEPKVAHRGLPTASVSHGNHVLERPVVAVADALPLLEILHFPMRTYAQFERKVVNIGTGYEQFRDRPPEVGTEQLLRLAMHREGRLADHFADALLDQRELDDALASGALVADTRLRRFMKEHVDGARGQSPVGDPGAVALLAGAWRAVEDAAAARASLEPAEQEAAQLRAELDARDAELAARCAERDTLRRDLAAVQSSRLFRSTAMLRRLWYRRPGA